MAERGRGMGRGLAAILAATPREDAEELRRVPVEMVVPNPRQPRRSFDEESLHALAESIRARGVLQPVLVRPAADGRFELIAGERRWRAARAAELEFVPAIVRAQQDAESLELALIENMAREDLNPVEEARACAALVEELGLSREEVGLRLGRSRVAVSNLIRLLDLPDEALELIEQGLLTEGHGRALLLADDHNLRRTLARSAAAEGWSVRELESVARETAAPMEVEEPGGPVARAPRTVGLHPDQAAGAQQIRELFEPVVGGPVAVKPQRKGGYQAILSFASLDEALETAQRLAAAGAGTQAVAPEDDPEVQGAVEQRGASEAVSEATAEPAPLAEDSEDREAPAEIAPAGAAAEQPAAAVEVQSASVSKGP